MRTSHMLGNDKLDVGRVPAWSGARRVAIARSKLWHTC
jgi:hypothetical protein